MTLGTLRLLGTLAAVAACVPPAAGLARWRHHDNGQRAIWWWLLAAAALGVTIVTLSVRNHVTATLAWATFPLYGWLGIRGLTRVAGGERVRRLAFAALGAYGALWLAAGVFESRYTSYSGPLLWLLLSGTATAVLLHRVHAARAPLRDFGALTAVAVLVTYLPGLALEPVSAVLHEQSPQLLLDLWGARQILGIAGSALFTWAWFAERSAA